MTRLSDLDNIVVKSDRLQFLVTGFFFGFVQLKVIMNTRTTETQVKTLIRVIYRTRFARELNILYLSLYADQSFHSLTDFHHTFSTSFAANLLTSLLTFLTTTFQFKGKQQ